MILLLDIGNTHIHAGLADRRRVTRSTEFLTGTATVAEFRRALRDWVGAAPIEGACLASVVPKATRPTLQLLRSTWGVDPWVLTHRTVTGIGMNYPRPSTIGADRLANAVAARHRYGAPCVVVDFGTAATFDLVDPRGRFAGGVIIPGLNVMTEYLHEKTALLPRITIRATASIVGASTRDAMRIGAFHGYGGMVRELLNRLRKSVKSPRLPVVATGGDAKWMARHVPGFTAVEPLLTLEGLRLVWALTRPNASSRGGS